MMMWEGLCDQDEIKCFFNTRGWYDDNTHQICARLCALITPNGFGDFGLARLVSQIRQIM